jgi:plasmid maintenance system antidote protein VapI
VTAIGTSHHGPDRRFTNSATRIMNGEPSISAHMAIRLGQAFGTTPQYWMSLQTIYVLKRARAETPAEALRIAPYAMA